MYKCIMYKYIFFTILMSCLYLVLSIYVPYLILMLFYYVVIAFGTIHSGHQLEKIGDGYVKKVYPEIYRKYIEYRNTNLWVKSGDLRPHPIAPYLAQNYIDLNDLDNSIIEKYNSDINIKNLKKDGSLYVRNFIFSIAAMFMLVLIGAILAGIFNPAYK